MQPYILKPNILKSFIANIIKLLVSIGVVVIIMLIFNYFVQLEFLIGIMHQIGIEIKGLTSADILINFIIISFTGSVIFLSFNYILLKNTRFEFQNDKLMMQTPQVLIFLINRVIPYNNILNVSYETSLLDEFFQTGTLIISLAGMGESSVKIKYIENAGYSVSVVKRLVDNYRHIKQIQFENEKAIKSIVNMEVY